MDKSIFYEAEKTKEYHGFQTSCLYYGLWLNNLFSNQSLQKKHCDIFYILPN